MPDCLFPFPVAFIVHQNQCKHCIPGVNELNKLELIHHSKPLVNVDKPPSRRSEQLTKFLKNIRLYQPADAQYNTPAIPVKSLVGVGLFGQSRDWLAFT